MAEINVVWQDRKRTLFGLPWSFTKYSLTEEKLLVETGFLNKKEEEILSKYFLSFASPSTRKLNPICLVNKKSPYF